MAASEMCIPYPPPLQTSVGFISVVFVNFPNHRQRDYKLFKITSDTIDKRATIRDKIIAKLSLASLPFVGRNVDVNIRSRSSPYPTLS